MPTSESRTTVVAVIPLCFAMIGAGKNSITIKAAEDLTATLEKDKSLRVIPQKELIAAFTNAKLSYNDVTDKKLGELDKALPSHDIVVFLGPYPSKGGWFRAVVMRSSDGIGKSLYTLVEDQEKPVSVNAKEIADMIKGAMDAPRNAKDNY